MKYRELITVTHNTKLRKSHNKFIKKVMKKHIFGFHSACAVCLLANMPRQKECCVNSVRTCYLELFSGCLKGIYKLSFNLFLKLFTYFVDTGMSLKKEQGMFLGDRTIQYKQTNDSVD